VMIEVNPIPDPVRTVGASDWSPDPAVGAARA